MATRENGKQWVVREQVIEDPASGLVFQFEVAPDGEMKFRVFGESLPFGNREFYFNRDGEKAGSGTATRGLCRPAYLEPISE
jgi:hypothetical protein